MTSRVWAIVVLPSSSRLVSADVAGRVLGDFLSESVRRIEGAELRVLAREDSSEPTSPHWTEPHLGLPLSQAAVDELAERDVLIIDARAWIPHPVLARLLAHAKESRSSLRLVDRRAGRTPPKTMAIALMAGRSVPNMFRTARTGEGGGLEHVVGENVLIETRAVEAGDLEPSESALLVDSYVDVSTVERRILLGRANDAMRAGVRVRDPHQCWIRGELDCGSDVDIELNVIFEGKVSLGAGVRIGANCIIRESVIGANTRINPFSIVEEAVIGTSGIVGPYARIRPGTRIADQVQVGNYVEIKNSDVGSRSRINHHAFIGDASLAEDVTVGAGTITCNHNGVRINRTVIERGAYVGSGCNLVAPLRVGERATIGAGSTITEDVPAMKLTLARPRQMTIEHWRGPKRD